MRRHNLKRGHVAAPESVGMPRKRQKPTILSMVDFEKASGTARRNFFYGLVPDRSPLRWWSFVGGRREANETKTINHSNWTRMSYLRFNKVWCNGPNKTSLPLDHHWRHCTFRGPVHSTSNDLVH